MPAMAMTRCTPGPGLTRSTGAGFDTVSLRYMSNAGVTVDLGAGKGCGGYAEGDTYANVEAVAGSQFNDTLVGNAADNNTFDGGAGADPYRWRGTLTPLAMPMPLTG